MKTKFNSPGRASRRGNALMVVLVLTGIGLFLLASALQWAAGSAIVIQRNNQYYTAAAAAEAATEMVLSRMTRDFQIDGEKRVVSRIDTYRQAVPTPSHHSYWEDFEFSDGEGDIARTLVEKTANGRWAQLEGQYRGLYGFESIYKVVSNARNLRDRYEVAAAIEQEIGLASIPLFQFAIFYNLDLEINPGPNMDVTGPVHGNNNIYADPQSTLTFWSAVTSAMDINHIQKPGDPNTSRNGTVAYKDTDAVASRVSSLNLPIGTNNSPDAVRSVIEPPLSGEDPFSPMGTNRYYNKADLIILVSNNTVVAKSGPSASTTIVLATNDWPKFVKTNVSFTNKRENKSVKTTEIDVAALKRWSETNATLRPAIGGDVSILYVADQRSQTSSTQSGVRLKNGQFLPNEGLTVATPNPLYVQGHYNAPNTIAGSTDTSLTKPASLVADAITVLSANWSDANSSSGLSSRVARDTTVNAAFLAGIVPTTGTASNPGVYSGGVENFPRFLEKWGGKTFTYNGSMVVLFESKIARAPWGTGDVYEPPIRKWAFDTNFMIPEKRPPGTPEVRALVRRHWAMVRPGDAAN